MLKKAKETIHKYPRALLYSSAILALVSVFVIGPIGSVTENGFLMFLGVIFALPYFFIFHELAFDDDSENEV